MEARVLKKVGSARARKGTRHWDYGADFDPAAEKKALDPKKVMDLDAETETFVAEVLPEIENVYSQFGEGVAQTFGLEWNLRDPEVAKDILTRSNRLAGTVETTWHAVQEAIIDGEAEGETIDGIAKRIGRAFTQAKGYRARVIARTETIGAANAGALRGATQTGVVARKVWLATTDHRTRSTHVSVDGQAVPLDQKFSVGASRMDHPGDPSGGAAEVINCRCTMLFERTEDEDVEAPEVVGLDGGDATPIKARVEDGNVKGTSSIGRLYKGGKPKFRRSADGQNVIINAEVSGGRTGKGVKAARAAIEKVHAAPGDLDPIDVFASSGDSTLGTFSSSGNKAMRMQVSTRGEHPGMTFAHEFGHYFDHQDFGSKGYGGTSDAVVKGDGPLAEWWTKARETKAYKRIKELQNQTEDVEFTLADGRTGKLRASAIRSHATYLGSPRETWARSYAQFVAKESGDPDLLKELADLVKTGGDQTGGFFPSQWDDDDFETVRAAMRGLFKDQGLAE